MRRTRAFARGLFAVALGLALTSGQAGAEACPGDCNLDCDVTVDEVLSLVNLALGQPTSSGCAAGDADGDGSVTVDEILASVVRALDGCAGASCESKCDVAAGVGVSFDPAAPACEFLSSYRFFRGRGADQRPNAGVVPYDLNTQLFSDYTTKQRWVMVPPGNPATYHAVDSFDFPVGSVLIKTFAYPHDQRTPEAGHEIIETRLMVRRPSGWVGLPYVWNADKSDAVLRLVGARVTLSGIDHDGEFREHEYGVPNANQCQECHNERDDSMRPLGPKARHLNKDFPYPGGRENQLTHWARAGILVGAPADPATAPRLAVFDDSTTGSLEFRARSYLDVNCAHCHNPGGAARTTGVYFHLQQTEEYHLGFCKQPTAAGQGTGGFSRVIDPGHPETSVIPFRMRSTRTGIAMPELGRRRVHTAAVDLIEDWIRSLPGGCEGE